LCELYKF